MAPSRSRVIKRVLRLFAYVLLCRDPVVQAARFVLAHVAYRNGLPADWSTGDWLAR